MKTRFDKAVMKLYTAFHENRLDAFKCEACAVGNMCDNDKSWSDAIPCGNNLREVNESYFLKNDRLYSRDTEVYNKGLKVISKTGYSPYELMKVEAIFLSVFVVPMFSIEHKKSIQFKGLCEVVKYLAELDGVENPMEIMHLFKNKELVL